jgi:hypothetical protein
VEENQPTYYNQVTEVDASLYSILGFKKIIDIAVSSASYVMTEEKKIYCWGLFNKLTL